MMTTFFKTITTKIRLRKYSSLLEYQTCEIKDFELVPDFITQHEHDLLLRISLQKLSEVVGNQVEQGHFDQVIQHYRECHLSDWSSRRPPDPEATKMAEMVMERVRDKAQAFSGAEAKLKWLPPHLLELAPGRGCIHYHVDHVEYSGSLISGLCLSSARLLQLREEKKEERRDAKKEVLVYLPPRSLYLQRDSCRYEYAHRIPLGIPEDVTMEQLPVGIKQHFPRHSRTELEKEFSKQRLSIMLRNVFISPHPSSAMIE